MMLLVEESQTTGTCDFRQLNCVCWFIGLLQIKELRNQQTESRECRARSVYLHLVGLSFLDNRPCLICKQFYDTDEIARAIVGNSSNPDPALVPGPEHPCFHHR